MRFLTLVPLPAVVQPGNAAVKPTAAPSAPSEDRNPRRDGDGSQIQAYCAAVCAQAAGFNIGLSLTMLVFLYLSDGLFIACSAQ